MARTRAPVRAAVIATTPVPHATSRTLCPPWTRANFTRRAAAGVVPASSGAKCFQPCRCPSLNLAMESSVMHQSLRLRLDNHLMQTYRVFRWDWNSLELRIGRRDNARFQGVLDEGVRVLAELEKRRVIDVKHVAGFVERHPQVVANGRVQ